MGSGLTPSIGKKLALMRIISTRSGSLPTNNVAEPGE